MKKLFLIAAASTAILSSTISFAECDDAPMDASTNSSIPSSIENQWYLKLNAGGVVFKKQKDKIMKIKMKSNTGFSTEIGAGYYIMDNLRTDLTVGAVINNHFKKSTTTTTTGIASAGKLGIVTPVDASISNHSTNSSTFTRSLVVKHKPTIVDVLLNCYIDFVDLSMFKVFAGAGVGPAFVKERINTKLAVNNNFISSLHATKNKTNLAYQLSLGTSFEVVKGVKAEVVYSWRDYGKTKTKNVVVAENTIKVGGTRYRGNNIMAGLRFDM